MTAAIAPVSSADYHADQITDTPTLNAGIANLICTRSPAHAWAAHPRLNPDWQPTEEQKFDVGKVAHAIILEGHAAVEVVDAADWRTTAAKEARDAARAAGKVPLLAHTLAQVEQMVAAVHEQVERYTVPLFTDGKPEQTLVWDEDGVTCRARVDWLRDDHSRMVDLKTTGKSSHPRAYERALFQVGGDVQAAFYLRGLAAVSGSQRWAEFVWVVVEAFPPFAVSVIRPAKDLLALGSRKVQFALKVWRECLERDEWPGYGTEVAWANAPEWEISRWLEREEMEAA